MSANFLDNLFIFKGDLTLLYLFISFTKIRNTVNYDLH